jgi:hypothetical protein
METLTDMEPGIGSKMDNAYIEIEGWGYDADPANNPSYPMKHWNGADHERLNYPRAEQQVLNEEILHSNERPSITRVFGTSVPPKGISGALRRYAFNFSENNAAHWMTLLLADRVNVVEGIVDDLRHGHIPNIFAERGWKSEWKYNRQGMIKNMAIGVGVTAGIVALMVYRNKNKKLKMSV